MIRLIEQSRPRLTELCGQFHVRRLDIFGSATRADQFVPETSDLDFLVEFLETDAMNPADQYFGLLAELERLFGRRVDLVSAKALRNRYFIKSVEATREALYAA